MTAAAAAGHEAMRCCAVGERVQGAGEGRRLGIQEVARQVRRADEEDRLLDKPERA